MTEQDEGDRKPVPSKIKVPDAVIETSRDGVLRYDAAMGGNVRRTHAK